MKKMLFLLDLISFDAVSKFNLINIKTYTYFSNVNLKIFLKNNENNFLNKVFYIGHACLFMANQKIAIFSIKREFNKKGKIRNVFIFCIGITIKRFDNDFLYFIDYLLLCFLSSKKYDDSFHYKKTNDLFYFYFFNPNYLLGGEKLKFSNYNIKFNFYIIFKNKDILIKNDIINFYEKILLPRL